jgi:hypothetical protein
VDVTSDAPPADGLATNPVSRVALFAVGVIAVLALVEASVALVAPSRAPKEADWKAAAAEVRAGFRTGDLIVAAPFWADPIMRVHLGDLVPLEIAARLDDARFGRVWEIGQRGAHAPEAARGTVALEKTFGALTLRRVERPAAALAYDFQAHLAEARVTRRIPGQPEIPCPWAADRFQCPDIGFNFVHLETVEVDFTIRRALLAQPVDGAEIVIEYAAVPLGRELVVAAGLHDFQARRMAEGAVNLRVEVAGTPAAALTATNETGWRLTHVDTTAHAGRTAPIRFVVTSPAPYQRFFVFAAEARQ